MRRPLYNDRGAHFFLGIVSEPIIKGVLGGLEPEESGSRGGRGGDKVVEVVHKVPQD